MDELHGILIAYKISTKQENPSKLKQPSRPPRRQGRTSKSQNHAHAPVAMMIHTMKKRPTLWEIWKEEPESTKVSFL